MKNRYLFFLLTIAVASVSCRKHTAVDPDPVPVKTDTVTNPTSVVVKLTGLKINGAECAFDSITQAYYYPVSPGATLTGYTVNFDTTIAKSLYVSNIKIANGGTANTGLQTNQEVTLKAVNKSDRGSDYKLIITGLPIVMLTANAIIGDDEIKAAFKLVNPEYVAQKSKLQINSGINIAIRGATSRAYPKKNYKVKTIDDAGQSADVSLLGLREDNSWILDAMYIDQARMRNRVCTDLWNSFNNVPHIKSEPEALNGTRGYMTEVFLNGRYAGIYCLTEKLDRKQMKLKKQYGNSYKANLWTDQTSFYGIIPYDNTVGEWGGWEFEYPEVGDTPAPNWGYLSTITDYIAHSTDDEFSAHIADKIDIPNMVDYFIFLNTMVMPDNENKNTFFSFYDSRNAAKFFYSVWDMDGALGRNAGGGKIANQIIGASNNLLFERLLKLDPAGFKSQIKARWNTIKANQLSKATVNSRIAFYRDQLISTRAIDREKIVWPNREYELDAEATYMTNWYSTQFTTIDTYFNAL